jgi:hypothetical protein
MADSLVEALSGTEIIEDFLDQIRRKLKYSCDLRDSDSYGQGYSGTATISLKLYAMDATPVELMVNISPKVEPPVSTEDVTVIPIQVEEKVEVPQELDLEEVRKRSKESDTIPPPSDEEEARMPARLKRKYTRRGSLEGSAMGGGAVDIE